MNGLARICKMYGSIVISGQRFVWDYKRDKPVPCPTTKRKEVRTMPKSKKAKPKGGKPPKKPAPMPAY